MSRPEDIPQGVWQVASMAVVHAPEYTRRLHEDVARAIMVAEAKGAKQQRDYDVGHIMTVVESLMEGRMTDSGLSAQDHVEMQAQIEALDVVADEIQKLNRYVNSAHKSENEA